MFHKNRFKRTGTILAIFAFVAFALYALFVATSNVTVASASTVPANFNDEPDVLIEGNDADDQFGHAIAVADFNNDGYDDMAIGRPYHFHNGLQNKGRVDIHYGGPSGLSTSSSQIIYGPTLTYGTYFGYSLAADDFNQDGYADLIVGAYNYFDGSHTLGRFYTYKGKSTTGLTSAGYVQGASGSDTRLGRKVVAVGDLNDDGYPDLGVTHFYVNQVSFYTGHPTDTINSTVWETTTNVWQAASSEISLAYVGDTNGDGVDDVLIGSPDYDYGANYCVGRADVYSGSATIDLSTPIFTTYGEYGYASGRCTQLGQSVTSMGDVNDDGYMDFAVSQGAGYVNNDGDGRGVLVYLGNTAGPTATWQISITGAQNTGNNILGGYDLNYDGNPDLLTSARYPYHVPYKFGIIMLFQGDGTTLEDTQAWTGERDSTTASNLTAGPNLNQNIGVGDFNGDGLPDVAVGTPIFTYGQWYEGSVVIWENQGDRAITGLEITASDPFDISGTPTFTASVTAGDNVTYEWLIIQTSANDNITANGAVVTEDFDVQYTALVTATNNSSVMTDTLTVTLE